MKNSGRSMNVSTAVSGLRPGGSPTGFRDPVIAFASAGVTMPMP